jgi:hypothetical protein
MMWRLERLRDRLQKRRAAGEKGSILITLQIIAAILQIWSFFRNKK